MSKTLINTLLKTNTSLKAKLKLLDDKRKPLADELERIDGALKALGHAENTDEAAGAAAPAPTESHAEPIPPQTGTGDDAGIAHQNFVAGLRGKA